MTNAAVHAPADATRPVPPLLSAVGLVKHFGERHLFRAPSAPVRAVDGVSFDVAEGETLGVVGESGCGKSTAARLVMQIIATDMGTLRFRGEEVGSSSLPLSRFRTQVQMVFQDSYASLNPRLTAEDTVAFGLRVHGAPRSKALASARAMLQSVGLEPRQFGSRYPHELSGGQRQRVNIARALALRPRLLILDEAVSALDKSVEAQILNLLLDLKAQFGLTFMFISHDLNVVRFMSDRVMVMYLGKVVEIGTAEQVLDAPRHPYTAALLASMPSMDPDRRTQEAPVSGDPPNPIHPPSGCRFHTRCKFVADVCHDVEPALYEAEKGHRAACHISIPGSGHPLAPA